LKLTQNLLTQQKVVMTPALRQAISILHMSGLELQDYLRTAIEENPMLEEAEKKDAELQQEQQASMLALQGWLRENAGYQSYELPNEVKDDLMKNLPAQQETLYEHLSFQLNVSCNDRSDQKIGDYLIGCIDSKGYLTAPVEEIADTLKVSAGRVLNVLKLVQSFQPYGVGARDLVECLLIQLEQYGRLNSLYAEIVKKHLIELGAGKLNKIASSLGVNVQKIQEACDFIRSLDPKPGLQYGYDDIRYIVPDVIVEKVGGDYIVTVNQAGLPKIVFNRMCAEILRNPQQFSGPERKYIQDKMNAGVWLLKCLDQRRLTLNRVANLIVAFQRGFLDHGVKRIKPLTMKRLADELEVHESTISRAIAHKYIQTPRGLFEMKYFFSNSLDSQSGDGKLSSTYIKSILAEIVAAEDPFHPLSDQLIVERMEGQGVKLSRRTVAKYRQELNIPAATARRRYES
jgi:RNA polymerase sigma-54 factor